MKAVLICILLLSCIQPAFALDIDQVKADLQPLELSSPYQPTPAIEAYFDFYNLSPTNAQHWFGTIKSESQTLVAHVFQPLETRGTVFLAHGYLDHTATLSKLIHEGLARNYTIVSWDLPGHGLTTGLRTDTGDFALCANQLKDILERADGHLPRPFHLVAHSTGASISMEFLYNTPTNTVCRTVFLAPLVRHTQWGWAKFGYNLAKPFTDHIRRQEKINSSDEGYLEFARNDPLVSKDLSFEYLEALYAWEKRVQNYPQSDEPILIIQGEDDDIVKWKYNFKFLHKKMPNATFELIPGARHQLANESEEYRQQVFELIFDWLEK